MGVTRVGTVCVVLCSGDEERRVRGTGGVCRCGGDRGVEPLGINILVQLPRGSFNVVQLSRNRTRMNEWRIRTRIEQCRSVKRMARVLRSNTFTTLFPVSGRPGIAYLSGSQALDTEVTWLPCSPDIEHKLNILLRDSLIRRAWLYYQPRHAVLRDISVG